MVINFLPDELKPIGAAGLCALVVPAGWEQPLFRSHRGAGGSGLDPTSCKPMQPLEWEVTVAFPWQGSKPHAGRLAAALLEKVRGGKSLLSKGWESNC